MMHLIFLLCILCRDVLAVAVFGIPFIVKPVTIQEGDTLNLTCDFQNIKFGRYMAGWEFNGMSATIPGKPEGDSIPHVIVNEQETTLTIKHVTKDHAGTFVCDFEEEEVVYLSLFGIKIAGTAGGPNYSCDGFPNSPSQTANSNCKDKCWRKLTWKKALEKMLVVWDGRVRTVHLPHSSNRVYEPIRENCGFEFKIQRSGLGEKRALATSDAYTDRPRGKTVGSRQHKYYEEDSIISRIRLWLVIIILIITCRLMMPPRPRRR